MSKTPAVTDIFPSVRSRQHDNCWIMISVLCSKALYRYVYFSALVYNKYLQLHYCQWSHRVRINFQLIIKPPRNHWHSPYMLILLTCIQFKVVGGWVGCVCEIYSRGAKGRIHSGHTTSSLQS